MSEDFVITKNNKEFIIPKNCGLKIIYDLKETKNIYICICRENHFVYFREYLISLNLFDAIILYSNVSQTLILNYENAIPIFIFDLDEHLISFNLSKKIQILNMEQMSIYPRYLLVRQFYDKGYSLIDYSMAHRLHFPKTTILPYLYNEKEINHLKSLHKKYEYDICMIGCNSEARFKIFNALLSKGIKMIDAKGWGDDRDSVVANSKILLNVHFRNDYQIYEHLRCDRWMFAGKIIISESSIEDEELDLKNVYFYEYEDLVEACLKHLASFENTLLSDCISIIESRNKLRLEFLNN